MCAFWRGYTCAMWLRGQLARAADYGRRWMQRCFTGLMQGGSSDEEAKS